MEKYRFLEAGEKIEIGDEIHLSGWGAIHPDDDNLIGYEIDDDDIGFYRRPIPYTGKAAFLVTVSATTRVVLDCDGLSDEEIDERLAEVACGQILANPNGYIIPENVDWKQTKEDTECPFAEDELIETEIAYNYCNPQNNQGLGIAWIISDTGHGKLQVQRVDLPEHNGMALIPLESDEKAWDIAKSLGWKLDADGYVLAYPGDESKNLGKYRYLEVGEYTKAGDETLAGSEWIVLDESDGGMLVTERSPMEYRRPITEPQYRPFKEGDVIEEGDQFRCGKSPGWLPISGPYPWPIDCSITDNPDFRKLIK